MVKNFKGLLAGFFTAFIILIVRMHNYERPMNQFFWSSGETSLSDFFSYYKMVAILICGILVLLVLLYKAMTGSLQIKKSRIYNQIYMLMAIYVAFVLLSYIFCDYKEFSLYGYNDRFEGTLVLICYMLMLFFIIQYVNTEEHVKWIIYPLAISSAILGILGLSQALDHDFFRTDIGKKLITPRYFWEHIDSLNFTFQNKQIYQTVYNINYVSFYLTLLIPLFGMLFIFEKQMKKKVAWGALFTLLVYNLVGSASSGGFAGMAVVFLVAVILLNKRILDWKKPVLVLIALTMVVGGITYDRWYPELSGAIKGVIGTLDSTTSTVYANTNINKIKTIQVATSKDVTEVTPGSARPYIDYIETHEHSVIMSFNGEPLKIQITKFDDGTVEGMTLSDKDGKPIAMLPTEEQGTFSINDERFHDYATVSYASDGKLYYILLNTEDVQWAFAITDEGLFYSNQLGKLTQLTKIPAIGWENNQSFGSYRGYIWSRTIPMLRDTIFIGHGADTYCIYFPHQDYAGKYNVKWDINKIVDKPHNVYLGIAIGTGILSLLALLILWGIYLVQSFRLYFRAKFEDFNTFVGAGIFLGICGFLVAGLFNDSTVSVMPMFYGLLGTGIAINTGISAKSTGVENKNKSKRNTKRK